MISYNSFSKNVFKQREDFLLAHFKPGRILDIGNIGGIMGEGSSYKFSDNLMDKYKNNEVYGLDIYDPKDEKLYPNQFVGNIEDGTPFKSSFFDTVFMGEVIEHLACPGKALGEIYRVLKKDGVFILDTPNVYSLERMLRFAFKRNEDLGNKTHLIFYSPASLERILNHYKFKIVDLNTKSGKYISLMPLLLRKGMGSHILAAAVKN